LECFLAGLTKKLVQIFVVDSAAGNPIAEGREDLTDRKFTGDVLRKDRTNVSFPLQSGALRSFVYALRA